MASGEWRVASGEWGGWCDDVKLSTNEEVLSTVTRGLSLVAVVPLSVTPAVLPLLWRGSGGEACEKIIRHIYPFQNRGLWKTRLKIVVHLTFSI